MATMFRNRTGEQRGLVVAPPDQPPAVQRHRRKQHARGVDARQRFDVRFYLVTLLFIIFDLEVAFLFPWAAALGDIGLFGFWSMVIFLGILTIGFIYEWRKGALEWE